MTSPLVVLGQSFVRTQPVNDTLNALLIPALIFVGLYVVVRAIQKHFAEAIIVGLIAFVGLGIAGVAINAPEVATNVAGWIRSVLPSAG